MKILKLLIILMLSLGTNLAIAEEITLDNAPEVAADPAAAGEEAPVAADVPASKQELMQQAADGDVAEPRVGSKAQLPAKKFMKPNRSQLHASVSNQKAGYSFLDENGRKPGVIKLKSGLQYKVLKAGDGQKASNNDVVKCNYRGTLVDGTVFEQSTVGKPASIKVAPLMPGLKEALKLMPAGSKWQVFMPSELGFGSKGKPPKVGPDAVLIYDLELVAVNALAVTQQ